MAEPKWQLYRFDKHFPYRYHSNIPFRIKGQICFCKEWAGFNLDPNRKSFAFPVCKICDKLMHYTIFQCIGCGEVFVKNFKHTAFCPLDPQCWDCLQDPYVCRHIVERSFDNYTQEPLVKTRKISAEELANLDIEDFTIS